MPLLGDARSHRHACCGIAVTHPMPRTRDGQCASLRLLCPHEGQRAGWANEIVCRTMHRPTCNRRVRRCGGSLWASIAYVRGADGESHLEALRVEEHPALGALTHIHEVRVQQCDGTRRMDFHPLPERRLIMHLSGEVEIGTRDGSRHVFRAGDMRLMEDVTGC